MKLDEYLDASAPATDQRGGDDASAITDLLNCLSRAAVDTSASYIQGGPDRDDRVAVRLGDTLWYVAAVARRLKTKLSDVAASKSSGVMVDTFETFIAHLDADGFPPNDPHAVPFLLNRLTRAAVDTTSAYLHDAEKGGATVQSDLGNTLSYLATIARRMGLSLSTIAKNNLDRTQTLFGSLANAPQFFDNEHPADEQLPRKLTLRISEFRRNDRPTVRLAVQTKDGIWLPIGSPLDDNAEHHDEYRFHDVLHLAYVAKLAWSPVMRALFGLKRKSKSHLDRIQDGARAMLLEEALTGLIYQAAAESRLFENTEQLERKLLLQVKRLTRGLEVRVRTYEDWNRAILAGYQVFRQIKVASDRRQEELTEEGRELGTVYLDMNAKRVAFTAAGGA